MFSKETIEIIYRVISSWQVLAVTAAVILYVFLVSYVGRLYHRPHISMRSVKSKKKASKAPEETAAGTAAEETATDDELGLEEE
jgi:hypothetical protein